MATATVKKTKPVVKRPPQARIAPELFTPDIRLSARDSKIILDALSAPPKPNAKLKRAAVRFNQLMTKKS